MLLISSMSISQVDVEFLNSQAQNFARTTLARLTSLKQTLEVLLRNRHTLSTAQIQSLEMLQKDLTDIGICLGETADLLSSITSKQTTSDQK